MAGDGSSYVRSCELLADMSRRLGTSQRARGAAKRGGREESAREKAIGRDLALSALDLRRQTVTDAARGAAAVSACALACAAACAFVLAGAGHAFAVAALALVVPFLVAGAIKGYPSALAARRAARVLKDSTGAVNLMIMSLRHEASISRAIRFASARKDDFSDELRRCTWGVVMGRHHTFEDSLQRMGDRWAAHSGELKAALNSMVTASCEATEEGRRRALDRANRSMVAGARRRIEEYALSLSTPSMVMFGLGILLPIMVGSFLPMMSWDLWSPSYGDAPMEGSTTSAVIQTAFVMNLVFPLVAFMVASDAASKHPLERTGTGKGRPARLGPALPVAAASASAATLTCSLVFLDGIWMAASALLSVTVPLGAVLMAVGRDDPRQSHGGTGTGLEDGLFRVGARMLEGENFETALRRAAEDCGDDASAMRRLAVGSCVLGLDAVGAGPDARSLAGTNAGEAFAVVREAAKKDERAAGLLAMDISAYLRDLRELETSLKSRLRPTVSMMRMTAHVLGPVVLGVTYSIYLTLSGMMEGRGMDPGWLFLILGAFLAETNLAVTYFVWGIQGRPGTRALAYSAGACLLVSELVYTATAVLAS
ncbi:MAG: hypothetical protein MUE55_00075 [Thermoplasmata archaeon]|nr:hypothetical protein [Thermoplasmata archaeon]